MRSMKMLSRAMCLTTIHDSCRYASSTVNMPHLQDTASNIMMSLPPAHGQLRAGLLSNP